MSKPAPKIKFTILWNPIELPVKEAPCVGGAAVQRLDDEVLVLQTNQQVNLQIGLGMVGALLGLTFLTFMFFSTGNDGKFVISSVYASSLNRHLEAYHSSNLDLVLLFFDSFSFVVFPSLYGLVFWLLNLSLIQPRPSPVVLNRRTKKVYGSHRGKLVELAWKNITPIITEGPSTASGGVQRSCHLVFAELDPPKNPERRKRRGKGFMVYSHPAWGWAECRGLWEFMRTYMEESPKKLPSVLITPPVRTVDNLLAEGPYADMNPQAENWAYIQEHGRAKMGWQAVMYFFCAPFLLFNALQLFCRRQVKLPETALPPAKPENENALYKCTKLDEKDSALWLKASRRVAVQLLALMVLGMAMYIGIGYSMVHAHQESKKEAEIRRIEKDKKAEEARRVLEAQEAERAEEKRQWEEKINSPEYKQEQEAKRKAEQIKNCLLYLPNHNQAFCERVYERQKKFNHPNTP
jgi:hypothetical protein